MSPHYRLQQIRYGYRAGENHRQVEHPEEQATIRRVKALWAETNGDMQAVRKALWEEGYRNRAGNRMGHGLIKSILSYRH